MSALYKAISGMQVEQDRTEAISRNLAGAALVGYKRETVVNHDFNGLLGSYSASGQGTVQGGSFIDFSAGRMEQTGRDLDFAINNKGFFLVESESGNDQFLTRNGRFTLNSAGELITSTSPSFKVLGDNGSIQLPANVNLNSLEVTPDGTLRSRQGSVLKVIGKLRIVDVADRKDLESLSGTMFKLRKETELQEVAADEAKVVSRSIEGSNISIVKEMVSMMDAMRKFEMGQKIMKSTDGLSRKEYQTFG